MLKQLLSTCIDLVFPQNCHTCSAIFSSKSSKFDDHLCLECASNMQKTPIISCILCGLSLNTTIEITTLKCKNCAHKNIPYERLLCCYNYEGQVKNLLCQFKYDNRPYLAKTIAKLMINTLEEYAHTFKIIDYIVPMPLHPAKHREREFNQVELISNELSAYLNKPVLCAIKRTKNTHSQALLRPEKRPSNVRNAFAPLTNVSLNKKNILLIDDVVTTASTINEASSTIKKLGVNKIYALAFAKG
jgi:competence protein ComFC